MLNNEIRKINLEKEDLERRTLFAEEKMNDTNIINNVILKKGNEREN